MFQYVFLRLHFLAQTQLRYYIRLKSYCILCLTSSYEAFYLKLQPYLVTKVNGENSTNLIGRTRDRRSNYVKFVSHEMKDVPNTPHEHTIRYIRLKFVSDEQIQLIKEVMRYNGISLEGKVI